MTLHLMFYIYVCSFFFLFARADDQSPPKGYNVYNSSEDCHEACSGEHDLDCAMAAKIDNKEYHVCRCSSGYYSRLDFCQIECEQEQYWSLFTYGSCNEYISKVLPGACNKYCVVRVRVWTTVFIIILFVAAVIVVLAMLPNLIIACVSCCQVRKQRRHIEDLQIVSSDTNGMKGQQGSSWGYPGYGPYSTYGGRA